MFVLSAVAYLDRVNISVAGKSIEAEFHLDDIQLGWVFSSFVLGYALFQAPGGRIADRLGPRKVIAFATLWWGVFTALTGLIPATIAGHLAALMGARFALGLGESVVYPASNRLVASWIPTRERGLANGLIFSGVGAGAGISPPLIAYVMVQYGWRASFVLSALIGLAVGAVWLWICRDRPDQHPWVNSGEKDYIQAGLPAKVEGRPPLRWTAILANRNVLWITLSYTTFGYAAYIFFSWFFIYLSTVRGLNLKASALYSMLPFIAMAIGSPLGGWISDRMLPRYGRRVARCGVAVAGLGLAALFIALGTQVEDARLASVVLAGGAGALYLSQSSFWAVTSEIGGNSSGSVSGVMNMGNQLAGALTASLSPIIAKQFGWTTSFVVAAGLCFLGALAWLLVDPTKAIGSVAEKTPAPSGMGRLTPKTAE
jgi:MFS transporter, ACS family, glucarate transporter